MGEILELVRLWSFICKRESHLHFKSSNLSLSFDQCLLHFLNNYSFIIFVLEL